MNTPLYIRGIGALSIQQPFTAEGIFQPLIPREKRMRCIDPDFRKYISPVAARRMSAIIKRAIASSLFALEEGEIDMPEAIISGTGLGCVADTEHFLEDMIRQNERCVHPAHFIHSTHNTFSSQIAIRLGCHQYNNTHIHLGTSFDSALYDAWLLAQNGTIRSALVGGFDEMTETSFSMAGRLGCWRHAFSGEGATSFALAAENNGKAYARIASIDCFYRHPDWKKRLTRFLEKNELTFEDIDFVVSGRNGDPLNDTPYDRLDCREKEVGYKSLCGEYFTASAYGLQVAARLLKAGKIPAHLALSGKAYEGPIRRILFVNHWLSKDITFILLESCTG